MISNVTKHRFRENIKLHRRQLSPHYQASKNSNCHVQVHAPANSRIKFSTPVEVHYKVRRSAQTATAAAWQIAVVEATARIKSMLV